MIEIKAAVLWREKSSVGETRGGTGGHNDDFQ